MAPQDFRLRSLVFVLGQRHVDSVTNLVEVVPKSMTPPGCNESSATWHRQLTTKSKAMLGIAACSDPSGRNVRDCSQWRTESIPGCYDGQGGGDMN